MKKILLVASHGGHLSELKSLQEVWSQHKASWVSYPSQSSHFVDHTVKHIGGNPWYMLLAFIAFIKIIHNEKPDCVISTGSEIAIPAMFWAKLYGARTLYIECSARVRTASLSGQLLKYWVDDTWVQWSQDLEAFHGKAEYHGGTL